MGAQLMTSFHAHHDTQRDEIDALRAALLRTQRLALAGTRAAMLAHEFNNLMTPVLARAMDAVGRNDEAAMRKALDRTVVQVQKAIELSRYLLRIADSHGNGDDPPQKTPLAAAVGSAIDETIRPFAKDGIELQVDVPADLVVAGRPILVEQVLLNLLVNARQAMKDRRGPLRIRAQRSGNEVTIEICDSGVGIDPALIAQRFQPFLDADAANDRGEWQEVGLGLHVCRLIAQQHGARISVQANTGPGCTFTLHWPAT